MDSRNVVLKDARQTSKHAVQEASTRQAARVNDDDTLVASVLLRLTLSCGSPAAIHHRHHYHDYRQQEQISLASDYILFPVSNSHLILEAPFDISLGTPAVTHGRALPVPGNMT